ncbi:MAG TPA: hypothetical protein VFQ85_16320 [Mycobacteriales bacterium]|jgi:hypothetical protein|nr:hypothetical protein [Mycobacteriales bacterium]
MRAPWLPPVLAVTLAACGGSAGDSGAAPAPTTAAPATTTAPTAAAATPSATTAAGPGHAKLAFTGAFSLTVDRDGAFCGYYYPSTRKGVVYSLRPAAGEAGGWDFTASDDEGNGRGIAYLNTANGSYAGDARTGTIALSLDRTKATFDFDVLKVVGRTPVHVKGTITCPPSP